MDYSEDGTPAGRGEMDSAHQTSSDTQPRLILKVILDVELCMIVRLNYTIIFISYLATFVCISPDANLQKMHYGIVSWVLMLRVYACK